MFPMDDYPQFLIDAGWDRLDEFNWRSPYDGSIQRGPNAAYFEQCHAHGVDCSALESLFGFGAAMLMEMRRELQHDA